MRQYKTKGTVEASKITVVSFNAGKATLTVEDGGEVFTIDCRDEDPRPEPGDYVLRDESGDVYVMSREMFEETHTAS